MIDHEVEEGRALKANGAADFVDKSHKNKTIRHLATETRPKPFSSSKINNIFNYI